MATTVTYAGTGPDRKPGGQPPGAPRDISEKKKNSAPDTRAKRAPGPRLSVSPFGAKGCAGAPGQRVSEMTGSLT